MKLNTMPKEIACELLAYLAENETFKSAERSLSNAITEGQIKALLRELSAILREEAALKPTDQLDRDGLGFLSDDSKKIISCLSPKEEKTILKTFGLLEDK